MHFIEYVGPGIIQVRLGFKVVTFDNRNSKKTTIY